jgi:hypothetical protein
MNSTLKRHLNNVAFLGRSADRNIIWFAVDGIKYGVTAKGLLLDSDGVEYMDSAPLSIEIERDFTTICYTVNDNIVIVDDGSEHVVIV